MIDYDKLNSSHKKLFDAMKLNPNGIISFPVRPKIHDQRKGDWIV